MSSESVGSITMVPVAAVTMALDDLTGKILGVCGKDGERVATVFSRGTLVSGDSRYRWSPINASPDEVSALLDRFPDYEPDRPFDPELCVLMVFRDGRGEFEISREVGSQKRLLRRRSFWDEALGLVASLELRCERYSYSDEADVFTAAVSAKLRDALGGLGGLLRYSSLEARIRGLRADRLWLFSHRPDRDR